MGGTETHVSQEDHTGAKDNNARLLKHGYNKRARTEKVCFAPLRGAPLSFAAPFAPLVCFVALRVVVLHEPKRKRSDEEIREEHGGAPFYFSLFAGETRMMRDI